MCSARPFVDFWSRWSSKWAGAPRSAYALERQGRAERTFTRAGIPVVVPHRLYRGRIPLYDEIDVLMDQMTRHYAGHEEDLPRLNEALGRYREWLIARKRIFNRSRRLREEDLAGELRELAGSSRWPELLANGKLAGFLREIILDRRIFDEKTLRLI